MSFDALVQKVKQAEGALEAYERQGSADWRQFKSTWCAAWTPGRIMVVGLISGFAMGHVQPGHALSKLGRLGAAGSSSMGAVRSVMNLVASLQATFAALTAQDAAKSAEDAADDVADATHGDPATAAGPDISTGAGRTTRRRARNPRPCRRWIVVVPTRPGARRRRRRKRPPTSPSVERAPS